MTKKKRKTLTSAYGFGSTDVSIPTPGVMWITAKNPEGPMTVSSPVYSPPHYTQGKIECIDFIEDQKFGFHLGNAMKYIVRAKHKGQEKQDIEKAIWYLTRYLSTL